MPALITPFDASKIDPTQSGGQLPIGKHKVVAIRSEIKATKENNGGYLMFELQIQEGPVAGLTGPVRFNLYNASSAASDIANKQLSAMCHAINRLNISASEECHGIPFIVEVAPQKENPKYTEIVKFFDQYGNEPGKAPTHQPQAPQQQQPQQQPAPWGAPQAQQPQQPQGGQSWGQPQQAPQQPAAQPAPWGAPQAQQPQQPQGGQSWGQPQQAPQQPAAQPAPWGAPQQPAQGPQGWGH